MQEDKRKSPWTDEHRANHKAACNTPEFKESHRQSLMDRPIKSGPSVNSPLEKLLHGALLRAGLSFTTQTKMCDRYFVDIEILQKPVVIEADGRWHRMPDRIESDRQRDADIRALGFDVYRFDGAAINADPDACIAEVTQASGLIPDAEPVAIIKRMNVGPDNPLWRGGMETWTCDFCGNEFQNYKANRTLDKKFCNQDCYGSWMKAHPEASNRWLPIDWSDVASLYESGQSVKDLAQYYECSTNTVRRALARAGVVVKRRRQVKI